MNRYIVTAQILQCIKIKNIFFLLLYVPNNMKNVSFFYLLTYIDNNLIKNMMKWCKFGDICTIEGSLHSISYSNNKYQLFLNVEMITLNI